MSKKLNFIVCLFLVLVFVSACSSGSSGGTDTGQSSSDKASEKTFSFNLGHVGPADPEHPWESFAQKFSQQIREQTDGQITVNTFPGSQLGADREMTEAIINGTLDMGLISTIAMGNFVPELQVWDLPYIFPTENSKVDEILEGTVGVKLADYAEERGLIILAYWENDWRGMSNSKNPISSPDDVKSLSMRVVENLPSLDWFTRIGAIPTPMAFSEVYTALQMGTVDGQDNGPILTYGSGLYEVQNHYTLTKHMYAPLAFVVSKRKWEELSDDLKGKISELAVNLGREQREYNRQVSEQYLKEMEQAGVQITQLSEEQINKFQESALATYDELSSELGEELINEMLNQRD